MRNTLKQVIILGQVILWLAMAAVTWAGQEPEESVVPDSGMPGAVERSLKEREIPAHSRLPEISVQDEQSAVFKGGEGVTFRLSKIRFEGQRVFADQDLQEVVAPYVGQTMEVSALKEVTDEVTRFYKENGYFLSRAYVPPQCIKEGEVLIKVREGRLGEIIIRGNKRYSRELLRNTLKVIRGEGAVRTADVERGLLLLTDIPGLNVKATFKPGERPGTSDIVLDVTEDRMFSIGADFNNYGSEYVSGERYGVNAQARNLMGFGDLLSVRGVTGNEGLDGLFYGRAEYSMALGSKGLRAGIHYEHLKYELGEELTILNFAGHVRQGGVFLSYPIIRSRYLNWNVQGGLTGKNVKNEIDDQMTGKDKLRYGHLGTSVQWLDTWGGSNFVSLTGYQNFPSVLGGMPEGYQNTVRFDTETVYSKLEVDAQRIQQIPFGGLVLMLYGHGQYSADRVPSSEQIFLGGAGSVRGYDQAEFSGDTGYYVTTELRIPIPGTRNLHWFGSRKTVWETLQIAGFMDYGYASINDPYPSEMSEDNTDMCGAGAGLRFTYSPYVRFKLDWAKSIGGDTPKDRDVEDDGVWYVQVALQY
ncbi:Polypeptide-transport-associated domain protein ShlB-type [Desulfatibacillum aliphaticivorans]|uniref:Polypeptide-transport-associated domain protein ShlB-type n=1 Tax=Desulfatibacillum aliphaticivorans TaxID=218208 RepID=B8FIK0_DESAL|nr:ShlB/FhaC/HecB family hemolysin secretion/activation protein [Desulfatibacillum aliphaticivorans]ACL03990.1 Polypeptide-transport-associated domain protein ShlB-type [Desulfatibacillum aliphaticivorans]